MKTRTLLGIASWAGPLVIGIVLATVAANLRGQGPEPPETGPDARKTIKAPEPLKIKGIENVYRLSPRLYSGGQPEGPDAFSGLKGLGIRTIISVDGSRPDVEEARRLGLRYVHLPVGYDGVPREQALRIIKAARSLPGPVFIHCHHGKHRGPAAAALCGLAVEGWSKQEALSWLKRAGTSPDYPGLFATVDGFETPTADESAKVGDEFPERAEVPALVEAMVQVDQHWDRLKAVQAAGFRSPPAAPDVDPPHEALQLAEAVREILRLEETKARGEDFVRKMEDFERKATLLHVALREAGKDAEPAPAARTRAEAAFLAAGTSCTSCHARYRDR